MRLEDQIAALESAGLVDLAAFQPELEYIFRHALIQEAAYESLLRQDRRRIHRTVGLALEQIYPAQREDLAPLLAHHFLEAGDDERALHYFTLAGDTAMQRYACPEAIAHYTQALQVARRVPLSGDQLIHLYLQSGRALELTARYEEALRAYEELEVYGREHGDRSLELAALVARATIYSTPTADYDRELGLALSEQALALANDVGDIQARARILWNLMRLHFGIAMDKAVEYGKESLALARELNSRDQLAFTLNDLALCYIGSDQLEEARKTLEEAGRLWRDLDRLPMQADNLSSLTIVHILSGEYEEALATSAEARRISESIDNLWGQAYSRTYIGLVYLEYGELSRAIQTMEESVELAEQAGFIIPLIETRSILGLVYGMLGEIRRGIGLAQQALARAEEQLQPLRYSPLAILARLSIQAGLLEEAEATISKCRALEWQNGFLLMPVWVMLAEGELALARQQYQRAINIADELLNLLNKRTCLPLMPDALMLKAQALFADGQVEQAAEPAGEARRLAERLRSRRSLWPALALLADIEERRGNHDQAAALRRQARTIVESIAETIAAPELRAGFLNTPAVRALLERH
ncbi:MAG: hypothetical protein KatS3mg057_0952 [Herpetosiphonaceae bacterium]|nr:MAG: hypothetical protein KatS3mg057_0952 [Herpetosiphonaceae bacterium]